MAWKYSIRIGDLYEQNLPLDKIRDALVERISASPAIQDGKRGLLLAKLVEELASVEDADTCDWAMEAIYDLADQNQWLWLEP